MSEKKVVLLVDDVKLFLKLEETFFKRSGCEVLTADSGRKALEIAKEKKPDLVLLDYLMPDLTGDKVCEELKASPETKDIPVMIVSTSSKEEDIEKCLKAGADDYLTKPIVPEQVLARAAYFLRIPYRLHRRFPVNFRIKGEATPLTFTGFSRNLSKSGILFETEKDITVGQRLKLWLPVLPESGFLELEGEVVRKEKDARRGMSILGVKFVELTQEQERILEEFIEKNFSSSE